jgi:hypothetical protein
MYNCESLKPNPEQHCVGWRQVSSAQERPSNDADGATKGRKTGAGTGAIIDLRTCEITHCRWTIHRAEAPDEEMPAVFGC